MLSVFDKPTVVIVTGANRGYGFELCFQSLSFLPEGSVVVMIARSESKLKLPYEKVLEQASSQKIEVKKVISDLSNLCDISETVKKILDGYNLATFSNLMLFNNAATLGDVSKSMEQLVEPQEVSSYFNLNISSCFLLTSQLLNSIKSFSNLKVFVVNISSLFAVLEKPGFSLYCSAKAARDMLFKVLSTERTDVRVLNWAPGPMPTQMVDDIINKLEDKQLVGDIKKMIEDGTIVQCSESAKKLMELLKRNEFSSGAHIDYFDV